MKTLDTVIKASEERKGEGHGMSYASGYSYFGDYDDWGDSFSGLYGNLRPHEHHLIEALRQKWYYNEERSYQYLADAYNEHVRKENEPVVKPPPIINK